MCFSMLLHICTFVFIIASTAKVIREHRPIKELLDSHLGIRDDTQYDKVDRLLQDGFIKSYWVD